MRGHGRGGIGSRYTGSMYPNADPMDDASKKALAKENVTHGNSNARPEGTAWEKTTDKAKKVSASVTPSLKKRSAIDMKTVASGDKGDLFKISKHTGVTDMESIEEGVEEGQEGEEKDHTLDLLGGYPPSPTREDTEALLNAMVDCESVTPNDFIRASALPRNIYPVNPSQDIDGNTEFLPLGPTVQPPPPGLKIYEYNVELTFCQPLRTGGNSGAEFNVTHCLSEFVKHLRVVCPNFILTPYNSSGNSITHEDQLPKNDIETCLIYYYNHRVHPKTGSLVGMISFTMAQTWSYIKDDRKIFFRWMTACQIYMKQVSFKASTISSAGFLYNAQPDVTRKDDSMQEFKRRLNGILDDSISYQILPRLLHVSTKKGAKTRFSFRALAVECDGKDITALREALFQLGDPSVESKIFRVTGHMLFVPFSESEAWSHSSILGMAKAHVHQMSQLQQAFIRNIKGLDELLVANNGDQTTVRSLLASVKAKEGGNLFHSIHKTSNENSIAVLYRRAESREAEEYLDGIHEKLSELPPEVHSQIFVGRKRIEMSSRARADSNPAQQSAGFATMIINSLNPQGGDEAESEIYTPRPVKRRVVSYSEIVTPKRKAPTKTGASENAARTEEMEDDEIYEAENPVEPSTLDNLQQKISALTTKFTEQYKDFQPISSETAELMMREHSEKQAEASEKRLDAKLQEMTLGLRTEMSDSAKSIRAEINASNEMLLKEFTKLVDKQNAFMAMTNNKVQDNFFLMHENIVHISKGAGMQLMHTEKPLIVAATGAKVLWSGDAKT